MKKLSFTKSMIAVAALACSTSGMAQTTLSPFVGQWNQFYSSLNVNAEYIDRHSIEGYAFNAFYHNCGGNAGQSWATINGQSQYLVQMSTGGYMTGLHVNNNQLLCAKATSPAIYGFMEGSNVRQGMLACPLGTIMTGVHVQNTKVWCAAPASGWILHTWAETTNTSTSRPGTAAAHMHACPPKWVMTGVHVGSNTFLCTPYEGPGIDPWSAAPVADPSVGPAASSGGGGGGGGGQQHY